MIGWLTLPLNTLALAVVLTTSSTNHLGQQDKVVYSVSQSFAPIKFKVWNATTGVMDDFYMNLEIGTLADYNVTKEELHESTLVREPNGQSNVITQNGKKVPIDLKVEEIYSFRETTGEEAYSLSKSGLMARTLSNLANDSTLVPEEVPPLKWFEPQSQCVPQTLEITVNSSVLIILSNTKTVASLKIHPNQTDHTRTHIWRKGQGLFFLVLNLATCKVTFMKLYETTDFGHYRDLILALDAVTNGSLIILVSLREGSLLLGKAVGKLRQFGSMWAENFLFRDGWLEILVKGGKTVYESLIPNLEWRLSKSSSPLQMVLDLPLLRLEEKLKCYDTWLKTEAWNVRRDYCENNEGFGRLCDCENPFVVTESDFTTTPTKTEEIPLLIIAGNRPRYLYRLIESVGNQEGVHRKSLLVSIDGDHQDVLKLTHILELPTLIHRRIGNISGAAHIASNLQFVLYNSLKMFPNATAFIILEEDLILSPDFYAYMQYLAPIFKLDPSIFCVSAYNHLSFPHTSSDATKIYRVQTMPAYGWMISREIAEYILPKILPNHIDQDWDYFLGSDIIRQDREILIPEISRSLHWATAGFHVKGSWAAETFYLSKNINKLPKVNYVSLESLLKENYESEFVALLKRSVHLNPNSEMQFDHLIEKDGVYALYVQKKTDQDDLGFRMIGEILGIWDRDGRDHHNHAWRLRYRSATLFVVGVPISPYRIYMKPNRKYFLPTNDTKENIEVGRVLEAYSAIKIETHYKGHKLPEV